MEKGMTFPKFAMQCARAFGALITMRDDPMDAPIPKKFKADNHHVTAQATAAKELARLEAMTKAERLEFGVARKVQAIQQRQEYLAKDLDENRRIDKMMEEVKDWKPPTKDHKGLKDFMVEQLTISRHDTSYHADELSKLNAKDPLAFYTEAVDGAKWQINYHAEEHTKEIKRADDRTEWVQELRKSLCLP